MEATEAHRQRSSASEWAAWAQLLLRRMEFYEDALAIEYGVNVQDESALKRMRAAITKECGLVWPEQPGWLLQPSAIA